jgi:peptidoglycan/LPS O-acetylase OafA/YrhL
LPMLLARSDVSEDELLNLTVDMIVVRNIYPPEDPRDRVTVISFVEGWEYATNSSSIDDSIFSPRQHYSLETLVFFSLALIFALRVFKSSVRLRWLLSRLTGCLAIALSFWLGQGGGGTCCLSGACSCGCS